MSSASEPIHIYDSEEEYEAEEADNDEIAVGGDDNGGEEHTPITVLHRGPSSSEESIRAPTPSLLGKRPAEATTGDLLRAGPRGYRSGVRRMEWMSSTIREWMREEGIPSAYEQGESSRTVPLLPLIDTPVEQAVPTLVARCASHDHTLHSVQTDIDDLQEQATRVRDHHLPSLDERIMTIEEERYLGDQALHTMHQRLGEAEERITTIGQGAASDRERADAAMALAATSAVLAAAAILIGILSHWVR